MLFELIVLGLADLDLSQLEGAVAGASSGDNFPCVPHVMPQPSDTTRCWPRLYCMQASRGMSACLASAAALSPPAASKPTRCLPASACLPEC
jgi:hypothetical protein